MNFQIEYGIHDRMVDVTQVCLNQLANGHIINIPRGDVARSHYFSDPVFGVLKNVYITIGECKTTYEDSCDVQINMLDGSILKNSNNKNADVNTKIREIHSVLKIKYGGFHEELPEQKMVTRYLTGNEKVLELGGNIGRNSLVIAQILKSVQGNCANFVSLECDPSIAQQLTENRDLNKFDFHIENSALSKRRLMQKGWDTVVSDVLEPEYKWINTITLDELNAKYQIVFDTLVLDCEGAFYYILMDMSEILDNVKLIIMENDYHDIEKKKYIDDVMTSKQFRRDYVEPGGWGPCLYNFFEVWVRDR
jgi:FkbM family methyltransferase